VPASETGIEATHRLNKQVQVGKCGHEVTYIGSAATGRDRSYIAL